MGSDDRRIVSVDFWRGFALLTIFINHVPGHLLGRYTFRNFGVSDAAELFVLLAGVSAAFAYVRPFTPGARMRVTARIWTRAFNLYAAHLALLLVAVAVIGGFVVQTGDTRVLTWYHLDLITEAPLESLVGIALLTFQPAYLNILPLYVSLLLLAPLLVALTRRSIALGLSVSLALYLVTQFAHLGPPVWPGAGRWSFNPLAWQLLFTCGLAIGVMIDRGGVRIAHRALDVIAPSYLLATLVWAQLSFPASLEVWPLPAFVWDFDKTNLALPRLLHVLALAYCVARLPVERWLRASAASAPLTIIGRHALPVFCLGTVLSLGAQVLRPQFDGAVSFDLLIVFVGFFLQWLLAWVLEWQQAGRTVDTSAAARLAPRA
ncbi:MULTISPECIES: OpgC family protein [unclassified Xanthobacter]|uniref:OpgC family protein n=1 Tax=unclassified Xanthobacter TaxID=2623496 RepID=UPI001EE005C7|nr:MULTISPECIES: OpgC domain-containing protein [unclassified Xanthobacter]